MILVLHCRNMDVAGPYRRFGRRCLALQRSSEGRGSLRQDRYVAFISFTGAPGAEFDSVIAEMMRIQSEDMQGYE